MSDPAGYMTTNQKKKPKSFDDVFNVDAHVEILFGLNKPPSSSSTDINWWL